MAVTPCRDKWTSEMTDRQRWNAQMHYQPVDRCFNMEFGFWEDNFRQWSIFRDNGITNNADADLFFNFDRFEGVYGTVFMHPAFEERTVEETPTTRIIQNSAGVIAEVPKDDHSTIPHFIKSSIQTPDDWRRMKAERFDPDHPDRVVDVEALRRKHPPDRDYPLAVDCGSMVGRVRDLLTFEGICYAIYDYPEMVEDMVEVSCVLVEQFLDQVLGKLDFDFATGWEDICFKSGPIVGMPFFEKVIVPRYKRIGKRLLEHGIDIWWTDCDGDIRPLIPGFLSAHLNTMFPFEVNSSGHPGETLERYGKPLRICGGVDKMQLGAGREAIKAYLETLVPLVERGGFIPHCDHRCPPNVDENDYLYYLDLKEAMFGLSS